MSIAVKSKRTRSAKLACILQLEFLNAWKCFDWKLSQYSGRLVIMAHGHGLGVGAPYDLGATAAPITSSRQMAETVRRFLGHLRAQRPAMAPTSRLNFVLALA